MTIELPWWTFVVLGSVSLVGSYLGALLACLTFRRAEPGMPNLYVQVPVPVIGTPEDPQPEPTRPVEPLRNPLDEPIPSGWVTATPTPIVEPPPAAPSPLASVAPPLTEQRMAGIDPKRLNRTAPPQP